MDKIKQQDEDFDKIIDKQEKDFLSAYKGHMMKIQRELTTLKKRAT